MFKTLGGRYFRENIFTDSRTDEKCIESIALTAYKPVALFSTEFHKGRQ
jgi:hypothetical protein